MKALRTKHVSRHGAGGRAVTARRRCCRAPGGPCSTQASLRAPAAPAGRAAWQPAAADVSRWQVTSDKPFRSGRDLEGARPGAERVGDGAGGHRREGYKAPSPLAELLGLLPASHSPVCPRPIYICPPAPLQTSLPSTTLQLRVSAA